MVKSVRLTDNGDNDGFADPNETVSAFITLRNVSDTPRSGIVVALATDDPKVDCLVTPLLVVRRRLRRGSHGSRKRP